MTPEHATPREPRHLTTRTSETIGETTLQGSIEDQYPGRRAEAALAATSPEHRAPSGDEQPTSFYLEGPGKATGRDAFDHVEIITGAGPNDSDLYLIGEAKGGLRPHRTGEGRDVHLSRTVDGVEETEVVRADQGSLPYFQSVAMAMARNDDPDKRAVGEHCWRPTPARFAMSRSGPRSGTTTRSPPRRSAPSIGGLEAEQVPVDSSWRRSIGRS